MCRSGGGQWQRRKALGFLESADLGVPTLIFLDINMPLLDGFQVAEQATPLVIGALTVKIFMLTWSGNPADRNYRPICPANRKMAPAATRYSCSSGTL